MYLGVLLAGIENGGHWRSTSLLCTDLGRPRGVARPNALLLSIVIPIQSNFLLLSNTFQYSNCHKISRNGIAAIGISNQNFDRMKIFFLWNGPQCGFFVVNPNTEQYFMKILSQLTQCCLIKLYVVFVRVMAWHLFSARPLLEPMLKCYRLDHWNKISVKFQPNFSIFNMKMS